MEDRNAMDMSRIKYRPQPLRPASMVQPRVLLFPFPALGHVKPFLSLAELLSDAGIDVVFLSTEYNHRRISNTEALASRFPTLHFETIPDGLPPNESRALADGPLYFSMREGTKPRFRQLIQSLNDGRWPITCIITDIMLSSPIEVAEEFGIPVIAFCPCSARYLSIHFFIPKLVEEGQIPYADDDPIGEIQGVPLFEGLLRRNHLPGSWSDKSADISFSHGLINQTLAAGRASALILNTFDELEAPFLTHLSSIFNKIYTIGPLHALSKSRLGDSSSSASALSGFWKEDRACMSWLDCQPPRSVVFVSFGSTMKMKADELREFWYGLVSSGKPFLCVLRSDVVSGGEAAELIEQMAEEEGAGGKLGMVVEWAAQEKVLSHPAVGGFLTHCGWNSTVESIAAGVPMMCWPILGDQPSNATWIDRVWKIGVERNNREWDRLTVEKMVRALMEGQKRVEIQRSMEKLSKLANEKVVRGINLHPTISLKKDTPTTSEHPRHEFENMRGMNYEMLVGNAIKSPTLTKK
uniref:Mogroside I-A1 synthase n=1 Tax=Siraitia grosvenorii TaxID=190515 RepID=GT721_SIRGR